MTWSLSRLQWHLVRGRFSSRNFSPSLPLYRARKTVSFPHSVSHIIRKCITYQKAPNKTSCFSEWMTLLSHLSKLKSAFYSQANTTGFHSIMHIWTFFLLPGLMFPPSVSHSRLYTTYFLSNLASPSAEDPIDEEVVVLHRDLQNTGRLFWGPDWMYCIYFSLHFTDWGVVTATEQSSKDKLFTFYLI